MKKLFFGLLLVAAGTAIFFLLREKSKPIADNDFRQEQIIGKWKLDSLQVSQDSRDHFMKGFIVSIDSTLQNYQYEFSKDGKVLFTLGDSLIKGSLRYEWNNEQHLVWKENSTDTVGEIYKVSRLTNDSLALQAQDSSFLMFTKVN